mmetsp:Transcript_30997/g.47502  ORF Transcript_30997/g.47502 Transcript_30997/m.47502 type:complete len:199 (-) Transcript_30997:63-659(-)
MNFVSQQHNSLRASKPEMTSRQNKSRKRGFIALAFASLREEIDSRNMMISQCDEFLLPLSDDDSMDEISHCNNDSFNELKVEMVSEKVSNRRREKKKSVKFSQCEIREYAIMVGGDHQFVGKKGLSISLDWEYSENSILIDVADYERLRSPFRHRGSCLWQNTSERRQRLLEYGYTSCFLDRMEEKLTHDISSDDDSR